MLKVFLMAAFTYQLTYYGWKRLEHQEIMTERRGEALFLWELLLVRNESRRYTSTEAVSQVIFSWTSAVFGQAMLRRMQTNIRVCSGTCGHREGSGKIDGEEGAREESLRYGRQYCDA